jgi:hypothetical protein
VADSCEHGDEPSGSVKSGKFLGRVIISFSRRTLLHGISVVSNKWNSVARQTSR